MSIRDDFPVIITNKHVIDIDYRKPTSKYKDYSLQELSITGRRPDDSTYTFKLHPLSRVFLSEIDENDVALIEARMYENPKDEFEKGLHWHFGLEHLATEEIFENLLQPYDDVVFTGFPDQHDKLESRPILRSGKIASDPKFNYSWSGKFEGNCVAYEVFSSGGASGSPVFAPPRGLHTIPGSRNGYLIGINAGHVPDFARNGGHSGISYFYKSTVIFEILNQEDLI